MKYFGWLAFGALLLAIDAVLLLSGEPLSVGLFMTLLLLALATPVIAVGSWLSDRKDVDPAGHRQRVRNIGWGITVVWLGSKIF